MSARTTRGAPRPVQQQRAQATLEALMTAGELLLDGRDPEALSLDEILGRAGASPSSFYQRFASKEHFCDNLHARFCERIDAAADAWIASVKLGGRPVEDVAREGAETYLSFRRRHRGALASFEILEGRHPHLLERRRRVDLAILSRVRGVLGDLRTREGREMRVDRLDLALDLAISMVRGVADGERRARVLRDVPDAELADRLVTAVLAYLAG